jgi:transcriptional regulator with XRE-family HTH domain
MATFAAILTDLRLKKGWSRKELAEVAGIPKTTLDHWEQGVRIPGFDSVQALCRALGVKLRVFEDCEFAEAKKRKPGRPKGS